MRRTVCAVALFGLLYAPTAVAAPILVTPSADAAALAATLVGAGVTVVGGSETLTGASTQQGTFTGGAGILPFNAGLILTTGTAELAEAANVAENSSTAVGGPGDAALSALAGGGTTFDLNALTFDIISTQNTISFQFVFASEEYHEFVDAGVNDVFGFFLNGVNIALVPGTATPISIDTINCNENSAFYTANSASSPCFNAAQTVATAYDGLTGGLFAQPLFAVANVTPGVAHTLRLAIADTGDEVYDSAVFLRAASLIAQPPPPPPPPGAPEPGTLVLFGAALAGIGARHLRRRRNV